MTAAELLEAAARAIFANRMKGTDDWDAAVDRARRWEGDPHESPNIRAALQDARAALLALLPLLADMAEDMEREVGAHFTFPEEWREAFAVLRRRIEKATP